jgi:tetratricopeptide (TPR) repeat protein
MNSLLEKPKKNSYNWLKLVKYVLCTLILISLIFFVTIPWRKYVFNRIIKQGDDLLANGEFTLSYVEYQKASQLQIDNQKAKNRQELSKNAAIDLMALKDFLTENNYNQLLSEINQANSGVCDNSKNRQLIEDKKYHISVINLKFCANDGPKDYESWVLLGTAYYRISNSDKVFGELKKGFREKSVEAFENAYLVDPINKTAIENLIVAEKALGNNEKVDYWQKVLDNLIKISQ